MGSNDYPDEERIYGQSFLCISLSAAQTNSVGSLLLLNKPDVYASNMPDELQGFYTQFDAVLAKQWITSAASNVTTLTTLGGASFTAFAKNAEWDSVRLAPMAAPAGRRPSHASHTGAVCQPGCAALWCRPPGGDVDPLARAAVLLPDLRAVAAL